MPYTTPAAVSSGAVISKTTFGDIVIADLNALANPAACRAKRTTAQTITTGGSGTAIQFNAADDYDTHSMHDTVTTNTRVTVPTGWGGLYALKAGVGFDSNATGTRAAFIRLNGSGRIAEIDVGANGSDVTYMNLGTDYKLVAGDYAELIVYHTRGSDLTTSTLTAAFLSLRWVGLG